MEAAVILSRLLHQHEREGMKQLYRVVAIAENGTP